MTDKFVISIQNTVYDFDSSLEFPAGDVEGFCNVENRDSISPSTIPGLLIKSEQLP